MCFLKVKVKALHYCCNMHDYNCIHVTDYPLAFLTHCSSMSLVFRCPYLCLQGLYQYCACVAVHGVRCSFGQEFDLNKDFALMCERTVSYFLYNLASKGHREGR
jgi:hypothetical protein